MKLFALMVAVQDPVDSKVFVLTREYELSSIGFFYRNTAKETFKFLIRESFPGLSRGSRHSVKHEEYLVHIQVDYKQPVGVYIITDEDYPKRLAFNCLNKALECFFSKLGDSWAKYKTDENVPIPSFTKLFGDYQDPTKVDKLSEAQKKVDETEVILHDNIKKLLERQGDLDTLVAKSNDLSKGAKAFYYTSKKANKRCCEIF